MFLDKIFRRKKDRKKYERIINKYTGSKIKSNSNEIKSESNCVYKGEEVGEVYKKNIDIEGLRRELFIEFKNVFDRKKEIELKTISDKNQEYSEKIEELNEEIRSLKLDLITTKDKARRLQGICKTCDITYENEINKMELDIFGEKFFYEVLETYPYNEQDMTNVKGFYQRKLTQADKSYEEKLQSLKLEHTANLRLIEAQNNSELELLKLESFSLSKIVINRNEALNTKKGYKLRQITSVLLQELKKSLLAQNSEVTYNELVDEAIQIYCYLKNRRS